MAHPNPNSVADRYLAACVPGVAGDPAEIIVAQLQVGYERLSTARAAVQHTKMAGEVRFIKDKSGDQNAWGWGTSGPSAREIDPGFNFQPRYLKPLAETLRSALMALGHVTSAHGRFVKIKSRNVSPDGNLGGQGYIQKFPDMRRQLMNCIESLSAFTDTVYDEIEAPHWALSTAGDNREDVEQIMEDAEEIKDDPVGWAEEEEEEMDDASQKPSPTPTKTAFGRKVEVHVEKNRIENLWGVYVHHGNRQTNVTGDIYTSQRAAKIDASVIESQLRGGASVHQVAQGYVRYHRSASSVADRFLRDST